MKKRVIPTILLRNFGVVKTIKFDTYRPLGVATNFARVYNARGVDELVVLDIDATQENRSPDFEYIQDIAEECFMPLTVGGGIRTIEDVQRLIQSGADKVVINTEAISRPSFISEISQEFGSQCVVLSIDYRHIDSVGCRVFSHGGKVKTDLTPEVWAHQAERLGAGEILLNSIDQEGTMKGYDVDLLKQVTSKVKIPVIAAGGAGNLQHFGQAIVDGGAAAVSCSSIFHYTEVTPQEIKNYLHSQGIDVRLI